MGKDTIYSMRMTGKVRDALRKAASLEHRTMASLLDKIIADYLEKRGYTVGRTLTQERRKHPRVSTALPEVTYYKAGDISSVPFSCVVLDLSLGGALVAYPRGSEIKDTSIGEMPNFSLCFELPRSKEEVRFRCDLRRVFNIDNGLKIGAAFMDSNEGYLQRLGSYLA
jgi:hypothetical protein